jgi:poly(A) polymerase
MKLIEALNLIRQIATENGLSEPFIVGGAPRDKVMGRLNKIEDLDISTGDDGSKFLGKELSIKLKAPYLLLPDGHSQVTIDGFKLDFSSNFRSPDIENILKRAGMKNPSDFQMEQYSRDFTCNSLLLSFDLKTIKDPLGLGIKDINNKLLRTCLPAAMTLGYDNKRVVRVLYMAVKLGFEIDEEIIDWIKQHPKAISNVEQQYLVKKLVKTFGIDVKRTGQLLDSLNLWPQVPSTPALSKYIIKAKKV